MLAPQLRHDLADLESAERELDDALEHSDEHDVEAVVDALYRRGRVRREQHALGAAIVDFHHALEAVNDFQHRPVTPPYLNRASILLESARVYLLEGQLLLARVALDFAEQEALAWPEFPNWADLHVERARLHMAEGAFGLAEDELKAAVETLECSVLDAGPDDIYLELGIIRAQQGELQEALACLEIAYDNAEPHGLAWLRALMALGDVLWLVGSKANALGHYDLAHRTLLSLPCQDDPVLAEVCARAEACLEQGLALFNEVCGELLETLFEAAIERDGDGIFATTREFAYVATALDAYPRVSELVASTACQVASAALAFHMQALASERGGDPLPFEQAVDALTGDLAGWELDVALRHFVA